MPASLVHINSGEEVRQAAHFRRTLFAASGNLHEATRTADEAFDASPNCVIVGVRHAGEIHGMMRIHVAGRDIRHSPARSVFSDVIDPLLDGGFRVVDSSGFCVREDRAAELMRTATRLLAASIHIARRVAPSRMIATARGRHDLFYRQVLGGTLACGPRVYPGRVHPLALYLRRTEDMVDWLNTRQGRRFDLDHADRTIVDRALETIMDSIGSNP